LTEGKKSRLIAPLGYEPDEPEGKILVLENFVANVIMFAQSKNALEVAFYGFDMEVVNPRLGR
jgi:hypothetical protein